MENLGKMSSPVLDGIQIAGLKAETCAEQVLERKKVSKVSSQLTATLEDELEELHHMIHMIVHAACETSSTHMVPESLKVILQNFLYEYIDCSLICIVNYDKCLICFSQSH